MRTRQTTRKLISLPGRYSTGFGAPQDVTLRNLSQGGCMFSAEGKRFALGSPLQIYIGATGPHRAVVIWAKDGDVGLAFHKPLSKAQFASFQASHIPDALDENAAYAFEDISDLAPRRFC